MPGKTNKIHFIAVGGAAMHNLALALHEKGYQVTGSDDEIFDPAYTRLKNYGLLPAKCGWDPDQITPDIDAVILGMHAKADNPELKKARKLNIKIYSYPEYLFEQTKNKIRVVIAGSHGKTTITAMIIHVLKKYGRDIDFMVGSQIEGFKTMVSLSDNTETAVFEGDEYLSSSIDPRPKFLQYKPNIALISGIAWDHINVFPTYKGYIEQFKLFSDSVRPGGKIVYFSGDNELCKVISRTAGNIEKLPYNTPDFIIYQGKVFLKINENKKVPLQIFGEHNLQNLEGARNVCNLLGISDNDFYTSVSRFKGTAKRLQCIYDENDLVIYLDFAHSPSKVKATVDAIRQKFPQKKLICILELHTFSSLNRKFIPLYKGSMEGADIGGVYYSNEVLKHKNLAQLDKDFVCRAFDNKNLKALTSAVELENFLKGLDLTESVVLLMSSGNFGGLDIKNTLTERL
ncbi:MAG: peptidoglycan synthetase [Bacteroidales bacterium]|nr:peptidoglycan synthetase [Bacteroidales bacterium]